MPFFSVVKGHDAYVNYIGAVEADSKENALTIASTWPTRNDVKWHPAGDVSEFDDAEFFLDRVEDLEVETFEDAVQQIHDAYDFVDVQLRPAERDTVLVALRFYQEALTRGVTIHEGLEDIATNGYSHPALDADAIDNLCETINV